MVILRYIPADWSLDWHCASEITHIYMQGKEGYMDAAELKDLIIAEDDILRDGGRYPEYMATMFIVIEGYSEGIVSGYLQTFYYEEPFYFRGLDNMLVQIETIMDAAAYPSKCNEYRHFSRTPWMIENGEQDGKENAMKPEKLQKASFNINGICTVSKKALFSIRVYARRNSSMQGILKNYKGSVSFRSGMDVIRVMHEYLKEELDGYNGFKQGLD